jgi:SAM-dependent methyltransferase
MSNRIEIVTSDPIYNASHINDMASNQKSLIALDIETKMQFRTEDGEIYHEYAYPSDRHIQNCGGYIDKLLKYRSQAVRDEIRDMLMSDLEIAISPVLKGRSILVDILLAKMISRFNRDNPGVRAKVFDHGCTVAEHYEMIDQMLKAHCSGSAREMISYYGLDVSPLVLSAARAMHATAPPQHFQLMLAEGSNFELATDTVDFSLSVGVVNHVHDPHKALNKILQATRHGAVLVLWVTSESEGFWAVNHSGVPNYFFSIRDLRQIALHNSPKGSFYFADFTPENLSSQPSSYYGISDERLNCLGSYTLAFCSVDYVVHGLKPVDFGSNN